VEIGECGGKILKSLANYWVSGDSARAGDGLDFPELGAVTVVMFAGGEGMNQGTLSAVGSQPCIGGKGDAVFSGAGKELHHLGGEFLDAVEVPGSGIGDEGDVEVGSVSEFAAAEFTEADNGEGGFAAPVTAEDGLEGVLEAGVGQVGEFLAVVLGIYELQDIPEAEAHELGLVVTADPGQLVLVIDTSSKFIEDLGGGFASGQLSAEHKIFDQVRGANGGFGEELGAVEEEE
jgi:hypothetical protein